MRIGSLFSGIGGLELGLERAGCGEVVWQCEADPFARRVLAKHWPDVPIYKDVRYFGAWAPVPDVDIICGGFPCQDISNAGKGRGLAGSRSGLFFELARVVRLVRPRYIVLENVSAILTRGGARVLGEIAACGYDGVWDCVPAAAVGAPHRRDRYFFVGWLGDTDSARSQGHWTQHGLGAFGGALQSRRPGPWEPQPRVGRAADGVPSGVDGPRVTWPTPAPYSRPAEPWEGDTPRTIIPVKGDHRRDRLKALGNAVVPQVAEVVGRVLMQIHAERA